MGEHDDHRQRVFNRFLREGLSGFEEHTALEFLLFLSYKRGDTNELAHRLIRQFGSLSRVLDAPVEELEHVPGIGHTSAVVLKFIPEMCAYYLDNKVSDRVPLDSAERSSAFFLPKFYAKTTEEFYMAAVDDRRMLLRCTLLGEGIVNAASVCVAKVVSEALRCGATGVLLAHNHPRGVAIPSSNDLAVTHNLGTALHMVNVELLDHLIFTEDEYISLAAAHYMTPASWNMEKRHGSF